MSARRVCRADPDRSSAGQDNPFRYLSWENAFIDSGWLCWRDYRLLTARPGSAAPSVIWIAFALLLIRKLEHPVSIKHKYDYCQRAAGFVREKLAGGRKGIGLMTMRQACHPAMTRDAGTLSALEPGPASAQVVSHCPAPGMTACMIVRGDGTRYSVRLSVPRNGGWRTWGAVSSEFERRLAEQESPAVIAPRIESETRRGRDYVRVTISMTASAPDVARALTAAWWAFRKAASDDTAGWDLTSAAAEIRPEEPLNSRPPTLDYLRHRRPDPHRPSDIIRERTIGASPLGRRPLTAAYAGQCPERGSPGPDRRTGPLYSGRRLDAAGITGAVASNHSPVPEATPVAAASARIAWT